MYYNNDKLQRIKVKTKKDQNKKYKVKFIIQIQMLDLEVKNFIKNVIEFFR